MDFFIYTVLATVYIMVVHFAFSVKKEFYLFLMIAGFVFGGLVGWWFNSWEMGLVISIIFSLIFY